MNKNRTKLTYNFQCKVFVFFVYLFFFQHSSKAELSDTYPLDTLNRKIVLSGKLNMLIPSTFLLMTDEILNIKYPRNGHQPSEVYTNNEGTINIALNHTQNQANEANLPEVKKAMDGQFNRPYINFIKSEIREINGRKVIVMEFISPAADTKIYNLMAICSFEGRLVMITFNCTEARRKDWEPIGRKIISSITLKK